MDNSYNDINFEISGCNFIIKKNNDYYIIQVEYTNSSLQNLDWIDTLNIYSINKKPSHEKIIDKIKKKLGVSDIQLEINNIQTNESDKPDKPYKIAKIGKIKQSMTEIKIYQEMDRIKKLSEQNIIHGQDNKQIKKIFNDNTIRDIIINEYIKLWQLNNDIININIRDNIYIWDITYNLTIKIHIKILFDSNYFPYVPPQIQIISPKLLDKLDHRISNCKIFKLEYWNPTTSISNIIFIIKDILQKYAKTEEINIISNKKINTNLYQKLLLLSSYTFNDETDEINNYFTFEKNNMISNTQINNKTNNDLKPNNDLKTNNDLKPNKKSKAPTKDKFNGIGFRIGNDNKWKIEDYENVQKIKEFELISILTGISKDIDKIEKTELYDTLENSLLIKFLTDTFNNTTLLEISKRMELFKICCNIMQNICIDIMTNLLFSNTHNVYNALKKLYDNAQLSAKFDKDNDIINNILFVWSLIEPLEEIHIKKNSTQSHIQTGQTGQIHSGQESNNKLNTYIEELSKLRFDTANIINSGYKDSYMNQLKSTKTNTQCMKRLSTEIPTLANDLPIHDDASIFLRVDETNPRAMRALITGPPDTPYDSGLFIFDIYLPPDYPTGVPCVNFTNTGGKRFNPNLYNCGKVCLSILGTYVGPSASQTEKWNTSSTLYQILLSIQSQILVDHPYFNEPGFQNQYKTPTGTNNSEEYNKQIRLFTMQHAILDLIEDNKYSEFKDVIQSHFKNKKNKIIEICNKWSETNNVCKKICDKIINKINTL